MECTVCKYRKQLPIKRCKHFELGGDKKRKVTMNAGLDKGQGQIKKNTRVWSNPTLPKFTGET